MESNSRKCKFFDTPGLNSGAYVFFIKPIQSRVQKVWGHSESSQDNDSPDDPGGSWLVVTDVGEPMNRRGGEELIHLPPEAPHIELWLLLLLL